MKYFTWAQDINKVTTGVSQELAYMEKTLKTFLPLEKLAVSHWSIHFLQNSLVMWGHCFL